MRQLKLIASLIFVLSCYPAQAQTVRVTSPSQHPYRHMPNELNTIDTAADEECYTYESDTAQGEWQTCGAGGGSGDVTDVGDCDGPACFTGTEGNTLTFKGATSGTTALKPTAIAGTTTITMPAETGTMCTTGSVCSGYAPSTPDYVTGSAQSGLSAEQSLGALTTGLLLNTVAASTGTLSAYGGTSCTNQFPRSLNASGAATCASVAAADITDGVIDGTELASNTKIVSFGITIDGSGSVLTTGVKGDIEIPFNMTITGWSLMADQSGSVVIDVWKDVWANYPPTVADTIAGSEKPTLSSTTNNQDLSLSSWTTAITAGDTIRFNVDSATTVTRVTLVIRGNKS